MILTSKGPALSSSEVELLIRARRQAKLGIALVHDLLDVMALEQGLLPEYEVLNLHQLLSDFCKDYQMAVEQKKLKLHYENRVRQWRVLADADRVTQLLQNLLTNALKFTEEGKNLYLKVTPFQGRRRTDPPYPMIVISLKDEGKGIPQDQCQRIFDRFTQLKEASRQEGKGLGLAVAKQISHLHGGNLWVQSEEGKGSTFYVLLPHVIQRAEHEAITFSQNKLIILEPEVSRRSLYSPLQSEECELVFAKDGVEAVTLFFHFVPKALIVRPNVPKLSVHKALSILKTEPALSKIPVYLALEEGERLESHFKKDFCDGIVKLPFSNKNFQSKITPVTNAILQQKKSPE